MRWLDRWLGVPLCFLLSLAARWRSGFALAPVAALRPRRVLCIQLAEMGSLMLAGPAVHWLQTNGVVPFFVSFARNRDALALAGIVAEERRFLLRTDNPLLFSIDVARFLVWAWRKKLDAAVDFEPCSRFSALLSLLSGARARAGFFHEGAYRGRLHNRPVAYSADSHMAANFIALAGSLIPGRTPPEPADAETAWRACLPGLSSDSAGAAVERVLTRRLGEQSAAAPLMLLNPNAGDLLPQRRWPEGRFVELAQRLLAADPLLCIGFIGAGAEAPAVSALVAQVASTRCASLAGEFAVAELPALFARCRLLVSNDSGPAHIASLTLTPTLVLFGPETPTLYRPLGRARAIHAGLPCSPCIRPANQRRSTCGDNQCMKAITVDHVLIQIGAMLDACAGHDHRVASANF